VSTPDSGANPIIRQAILSVNRFSQISAFWKNSRMTNRTGTMPGLLLCATGTSCTAHPTTQQKGEEILLQYQPPGFKFLFN
jgi:hypothetical protein